MNRYVCIHAHFYQPPRENPWLETVELQDSAYPYHDWNERITAECYAPNTMARILDEEGRIASIVNNYSRLSFNVGPTLLSWIEKQSPRAYRAILEADRRSAERFSGHGSALAQVYNHLIMPLANRRDKVTQVAWGIADFERRFGRKPEGMWLSETAVNLETLEILADHGIRFTILAPRQARRARPMGGRWYNVSPERIDPKTAYLQRLGKDRSITIFFYDGPISRAVAFERLLDDGARFARRLMQGFDPGRKQPQLAHVATDGETYGHHHRYGDMALAYALQLIDSGDEACLTNYGEFLERHPPVHEVEIAEQTSWSCAHGVGRWSRDCGCNSGGRPGWNQSWRAPLRKAFDWLRDKAAPDFERQCSALLRDPWAARDDYISVIWDRSPESIAAFFGRHAAEPLTPEQQVQALKLLELQRHALLMYTSCGWFFDELSGQETVQVIMYAGRVIQLARAVLGRDLEPEFLDLLSGARSNLSEHRDGKNIYEKWVRPAALDLGDVCAHYAISSLSERHADSMEIYCYRVDAIEAQRFETGAARIIVGRAAVTSRVSTDSRAFCYGVLDIGVPNIKAGVRALEDGNAETCATLTASVRAAVERNDLPEVVRVFDRLFGKLPYSVQSLFRDVQRSFLDLVLQSTLNEDAAIYRQLYDRRAPLMRLLAGLRAPLPRAFQAAAEFVINSDLRRELEQIHPDLEKLKTLLAEARTWSISLDEKGLAYALTRNLEKLADQARLLPDDLSPLQRLEAWVTAAGEMPFAVDFWSIQNAYHEMSRELFTGILERADDGDPHADEWVEFFLALGDKLGVRMQELHETKAQTFASVFAEAVKPARIPRATYRLQFNPSFTFREAGELVSYLDELAISDCYASPIFLPRAGSRHGYDVCDHATINPLLGGEKGLKSFASSLRQRGMGLLLDMVPNHMGIGDAANAWWMDVLENGPSSLFASFFDIEWNPVKPELANKVLLPILEEQYGRVLESGKIRLGYEEGAFSLYYYDMKLPVAPRTYSAILNYRIDALAQALGEDHEHLLEYRSILTAISYLPERTERDPQRLAERNREKEVIKRRIAALCQTSPAVQNAILTAVEAFNGRVDDPRSYDLIDGLIDQQAYRPAYWRVAAEEINYRRFFDVNDLAAIRTEDPQVFGATHDLIFRLVSDGIATGLRIDHIDGLYDPEAYLRQLQETHVFNQVRERLVRMRAEPPDQAALAARVAQRTAALLDERRAAGSRELPLYVVAEKILGAGESLPAQWAVHGTTGYDFLPMVGGLFVNSEKKSEIDAVYQHFSGMTTPLHQVVNSTKKITMLVSMESEIYALSHRLERIAERNRRYRDFTLNNITFALREMIACLSVYRTYITGPDAVTPRDRHYIEAAVAAASRRNPRAARAIFDFIEETLLLKNVADFHPDHQPLLVEWVRKFQQLTGPVMAKGVEDTAFYVYNRLVSLNEVGSDPSRFGVSVQDFHARNAETRQLWPNGMLATSTHDTKRGEDVRARISVFSEMPEEFRAALERWRALNMSKKANLEGEPAPDGNDEYLLYQTIIGAWPCELMDRERRDRPDEWNQFRERVASYMQKATREAKVHTSWVNPNQAYDQSVRDFVLRVLDEKSDDGCLEDMRAMARRVAFFGRLNSLSQTLLKLTAPGVPDIYQGAETWNLNLVDPDNRRPVDFELRRSMLADIKQRVAQAGVNLGPLAAELLESGNDGRIKLYLIYRALNFRRRREDLFRDGSYMPLETDGSQRDRLCAFARALDGGRFVSAASRLAFSLLGGRERLPVGETVWRDTWIQVPDERPGQPYIDELTGERLEVQEREGRTGLSAASVFKYLPVALLVRGL